jgi:lipopolysaccharide transport system permease protein
MGIPKKGSERQGWEAPVLVNEPLRGWVQLNLHELWVYRDLLLFLARRDISVRYKQTVVGAAWAVLQPLLSMVVFSLFFGRLAGIPSDGAPYPVFCYAALLPWHFFASAVSGASESLVRNVHLVTKVYVPRLVITLASILPPLVDLGIAFGVLLFLMAYYSIAPTWNVLWLPAFLLLALLTAMAAGLWLAALNVKYRDIRHVVPFLVQFWMFASPVAYPSSLLPPAWRAVYGVNPMAGVIEGFRWALLGTDAAPRAVILVAGVIVVAALVSALVYFRRFEETFADVI